MIEAPVGLWIRHRYHEATPLPSRPASWWERLLIYTRQRPFAALSYTCSDNDSITQGGWITAKHSTTPQPGIMACHWRGKVRIMASEQHGIDVEIQQLEPQSVLSIRATVQIDQLAEVMGDRISALWGYLQQRGEQPAGPPFARFTPSGRPRRALRPAYRWLSLSPARVGSSVARCRAAPLSLPVIQQGGFQIKQLEAAYLAAKHSRPTYAGKSPNPYPFVRRRAG